MSEALTRRLLAEGLGTGLLVATVVDSGIMAAKLAGGKDAVALLSNIIPIGAILVVLITILAARCLSRSRHRSAHAERTV